MATTATLAGTNLLTGGYQLASTDQLDFGTADLMAQLNSGDVVPEEFDQYLAELRYVRQLRLPMVITGSSAGDAISKSTSLLRLFSGANRSKTVDFVFTPDSGNVSTFKVIGGAVELPYDPVYTDQRYVLKDAVLHLATLPFVYGAAQTLGSSGAPLVTNTASPAAVTLTLSPTGDVPADVTLFVKNHAASAIRSLIVAGIGGNTTWGALVDSSTWTVDADGVYAGGRVGNNNPLTLTTVLKLAHFTAPTLPSDRPFRVWLRAEHDLDPGESIKFRIRLVSGAAEIIGAWRALPQEYNFGAAAVDMGAYCFPVGEVGQLGGQSTTVYVEAMGLTGAPVILVYSALFTPDDSTLIIETSDTSKTLAAASGIIRVESDQAYDNSGNPAGGAVKGAHIRSTGGRYIVYASQGYHDSLDNTLPWAPENVDVWATATPRYLHLA